MNRDVTIYIDVLFMLNFLINSCLFYTTGKICKREIGTGRLCAVSAVSALYAAVMFFPKLRILYTLLLKIAFTAAFAALAFRLRKPREILLVTAVFFLVSFAFGGAVVAVVFLTDAGERLNASFSNGQFYMDVSVWSLAAASAAAYGGTMLFAKLCRKNYSRERLTVRLEIRALGGGFTVNGFVDTGCYLCGAGETPAIAVEYEAVRGVLPPCFEEFVIDPLRAFAEYPKFSAENKITVLTYRGFGGGNGIIPAVTAESIRALNGGRVGERVLVGFTAQKLSDGEYNAIINPDVFSDFAASAKPKNIKENIFKENTFGIKIRRNK